MPRVGLADEIWSAYSILTSTENREQIELNEELNGNQLKPGAMIEREEVDAINFSNRVRLSTGDNLRNGYNGLLIPTKYIHTVEQLRTPKVANNGNEKNKLTLCIFINLVLLLYPNLGKTQDKQNSDDCFYLSMFEDKSVFSPFVVINVQFLSSEGDVNDSIYTLVTRNGHLYSILSKDDNFEKRRYAEIMVEHKSSNTPLLLPTKYIQELKHFLIIDKSKCLTKYVIEYPNKKDIYVKYIIGVDAPISTKSRNCLIISFYEKRELINTLSESGQLYVINYFCR